MNLGANLILSYNACDKYIMLTLITNLMWLIKAYLALFHGSWLITSLVAGVFGPNEFLIAIELVFYFYFSSFLFVHLYL